MHSPDRKSTRLNSSHRCISYAVFCSFLPSSSLFPYTTLFRSISRIMTDAEGIRNLVGTGLVQLVGGLVTATIALGVLFWLNWKLTAISILVLGVFGGGMAYAFSRSEERRVGRDASVRGSRCPN